MSPDFSNDFKEQVRSRTDLAALIGESVALTPSRGGAEYKCLCPFHDDHNPSMVVYPDRQTYRCWSCQVGGDCFTWVMEYDKVDFRVALETLAKRIGLEMPAYRGRRDGESTNTKAGLLDVLAWAENEFHRCLLDSQMAEPAREYLKKRGFSAETVARFKLGFHPQDSQWLLNRARDRFTREQLQAADLVKQSDDGSGYYDRFMRRVLFPIRNDKGLTVAFGGRVLPQLARPDEAKYLNSSESPVYSKSNLLFGFDVARDAIRKSRTAVVVEGYADCIIPYQFGVMNVVGVCGTALTEAHVNRLKRFAQRVVLMFDGDRAGLEAAEKALGHFLSENIDLRMLVLPDDKDPDEFLFEHGADAFRQQIENAVEAWDFKLQAEVSRHGLDSIDARHRVLINMLELLAKVPKLRGTTREDVILNRLAGRVALAESIVRQRLAELRSARLTSPQARPNGSNPVAGTPHRAVENTSPTTYMDATAGRNKSLRVDAAEADHDLYFFDQPLSKEDRRECELLEILFTDPDTLAVIRQEIGDEDFRNERTRHVLQVCFDLWEQGETPTFERIMATIEDVPLKRLVVWIDEQARLKEIGKKLADNFVTVNEQTLPQYLVQTLQGLRWRREERLHQRTQGQLAQQPDSRTGFNPNAKALLEQVSTFNQKRAAKTPLS